jgi:signal transduction histidine kinase
LILDLGEFVDRHAFIGFTYYICPDPSRNMTPALKLSYVANVDGTWFLGSGIYAKGEKAS